MRGTKSSSVVAIKLNGHFPKSRSPYKSSTVPFSSSSSSSSSSLSLSLSLQLKMASTQSTERVTKASSNQLLSKFADLGSDPPLSKRRSSLQIFKAPANSFQRKRSKRVASGLGARELAMVTTGCCTSTVKRRMSGDLALLPGPPMMPSRRSLGTRTLMRKMGMGKAEDGTKALLSALEKTWRKTVEGASKIFIEKHCSTHVRLISDFV